MYAIQKFLQKMVINQAGPEEATVAGRGPLEAKASPASPAMLYFGYSLPVPVPTQCLQNAFKMPSECLQNAFKMHVPRMPSEFLQKCMSLECLRQRVCQRNLAVKQ